MNKKKLRFFRGPFIYLIIFLVILWVISLIGSPRKEEPAVMTYSKLLKQIEEDAREGKQPKIAAVSVTGYTLKGLYADSKIPREQFDARYDFSCVLPSESQFYSDVEKIYAVQLGRDASPADFGFEFVSVLPEGTSWLLEFLPLFIEIGLLALFWIFIFRRQMGGGKGGTMNFGKSRAHLTDPSQNTVRFSDVMGADEEKEELREVVQFLKDPKRFTKVGAKIPHGLLMVGPPGTGKTLLARAVAGEAGVPFFTISGSDFVEMFVGVGASRVRDLFETAKKHAPSIVFIDEIDAVGRQRGAGLGGGNDEREQTLNQLLVEMDGFTHNEGVIVMAATNRSDVLDPALLRPGRFDRRIVVNIPDVKGREDILRLHAKGKPLADDVDLAVLARRTPMFTGADLMNVMNEAAVLTARRNKDKITMATLEEAITRVMMGPEKKSRRVTEADRRLVAYHEAGHAIVSYYIPECDNVHEITTIPRGSAGGYTMYLPKDEVSFITKSKLLAEMCSLMGGRAAEAIVLKDISTGASNDIKRATDIARGMVTEYGMSEKLGNIFLSDEHEVFLGRSFAQQSLSFSDTVNELIDGEVRRFLDTSYERAKDILSEHIDQLHGLAELLFDREKIDAEEFDCFMNGRELPEPKVSEPFVDVESEPEEAPGDGDEAEGTDENVATGEETDESFTEGDDGESEQDDTEDRDQ